MEVVTRTRTPRGPRGPYYVKDVKDGAVIVYDGADIHEAFQLMKKRGDKAKLYKIEKRKDKKGKLTRVHVLLAFRKGAPAPPAIPEPKVAVSF